MIVRESAMDALAGMAWEGMEGRYVGEVARCVVGVLSTGAATGGNDPHPPGGALRNEEAVLRESALDTLRLLGPKHSSKHGQAVVAALTDDSASPSVRASALLCLGSMGALAAPHAEAMADALRDDDVSCRMASLRAIPLLGIKAASPRLIEAIVNALHSYRHRGGDIDGIDDSFGRGESLDSRFRVEGAKALGIIGYAGALAGWPKEGPGDAGYRGVAVSVAVGLRDACLLDPNPLVRCEGLASLSRLGIEAMSSMQDQVVPGGKSGHGHGHGGGSPGDIESCLHDEVAAVRWAAVACLAALGMEVPEVPAQTTGGVDGTDGTHGPVAVKEIDDRHGSLPEREGLGHGAPCHGCGGTAGCCGVCVVGFESPSAAASEQIASLEEWRRFLRREALERERSMIGEGGREIDRGI